MATHSNILAWRTLWTEEPGGLWSMGSQEADTTEATEYAQLVNNVVMISGAHYDQYNHF